MASEPRRRRRARLTLLAALTLALALAAALSPALTRVGGDLLLPAVRALPSERPPSKVSLILIDEVTHARPPFSETPEVAWTPYLAEVLEAVGEAQPAVVGLDVIYPKTLAAPGLLPGFDRPFLQTLARLGRSGRLVLSEARLSGAGIAPYPGQRIAVGGPANVRPAHFTPDFDNVVRRLPATVATEDGGRVATLAAELAARAGGRAAPDFLVDFRRRPEEFAAFRLSDLLACARRGDRGVFTGLAGQVVLVGTALDVEDRHLAATRFTAGTAPAIRQVDCAPGGRLAQPRRQTTPGVLIQAYAVDTLLSASPPRPLPAVAALGLGIALFAILGFAFFQLSPPLGALAWAAAALASWAAGVLALAQGWLAPWGQWAVGAALLLAAIQGYRLAVEGRERRQVLHAFRYYLSPTLVQRLAEDPAQLKLGGERRRVAVMFVDLEGFTPYSARLADRPEQIVARLNGLFAAVGEAVESTGGYVDKFMGDAVMAVWGAPLVVAAPEAAAAEAALAALDAVAAMNAATPGEPPLRIRIGLAAGEVIAGNLGSRQRYNYTVIGDAVNRAARLQEACKAYGTEVLADGAFAQALPPALAAPKLATVSLRGLPAPVDVHDLRAARAAA